MTKLIVVLLITFFTLFPIQGSPLSLTWGDFLSFFFLLNFSNDALKNRIVGNDYTRKALFYIVFLFISSIINLTFFEGRFLNIFKTGFFSLIFFLTIYTLIKKNQISTKNFIISISLLCVFFLMKTWSEMQAAWGRVEFTNVDIFESSLNLNTWGFILVLFLQLALFAWVKKIYRNWSIIAIVFLSVFIIFSFSRTAYLLSAFSLFFVIFYIQKFSFKKIIFPVFIILLIFIFNEYVNILNFKISDAALNFFNNKSTNTGDDLVNTRFYLINIKPILEFYSEFNFIHFFFGDGVSVQHSFVSHTLIVSGILGFIIYFWRYVSTFKIALKEIKKKSNRIEAQFIILSIIVILSNDFVTNLSNFLPFAAYLSAIILAFFMAKMEKIELQK